MEHQLLYGTNAQFTQKILAVRLNGSRTDPQHSGDLLADIAGQQFVEHLLFAFGQGGELPVVVLRLVERTSGDGVYGQGVVDAVE